MLLPARPARTSSLVSVPAEPGVVFDASALVAYSLNDMRAFPVDELLGVMRDETLAPVHIPEYALVDARVILHDDKAAMDRLEAFAHEHGIHQVDGRDEQETVQLIVARSGVSWGMAHAMLLTILTSSSLATYAAHTLERVGYEAYSRAIL